MSPDDRPQVTEALSLLPAWGLPTAGFCQLCECVVSGGRPLLSSENANGFLSKCQQTHATSPMNSPTRPLIGPLGFSFSAPELETLVFFLIFLAHILTALGGSNQRTTKKMAAAF